MEAGMADAQNDSKRNDPESADYEEITSDEVDRVIEALETLMSQTSSENIRCYLEEAADQIFDLVYADEADIVVEHREQFGEAA
jgi:hypothetical protein